MTTLLKVEHIWLAFQNGCFNEDERRFLEICEVFCCSRRKITVKLRCGACDSGTHI